MSDITYELAVIGGGLIGSSAAKHLSGSSGSGSVCLIGPEDNDETHGAWFDEGRLTRGVDNNPYWTALYLPSIERYREIEALSGIDFYTECGHLQVVTGECEKLSVVRNAYRNLRLHGKTVQLINRKDKDEIFPYLNLPTDCLAYLEPDGSGHISPRLFVAAQKKLAAEKGCKIITKAVSNISKDKDDVDFLLELGKGQKSVRARKVLVAAGAYANFVPKLKTFFPPGKQLDITLTGTTVAYHEVTAATAAALKDMPSMVTFYKHGKIVDTYILPPIVYPDGKCYLKLGHGDPYDERVSGMVGLQEWYRRREGNPEAVEEMSAFIRHLIPDLEVVDVKGGSCVTAQTAEKGCPYIDEISPGLFVAVGGCGRAAKCADEIGRIAADLAARGEWTTAIPREECRAQWTGTSVDDE